MMRNDDQRSSGEAGIYLMTLDVLNMLFSKYKNAQFFWWNISRYIAVTEFEQFPLFEFSLKWLVLGKQEADLYYVSFVSQKSILLDLSVFSYLFFVLWSNNQKSVHH